MTRQTGLRALRPTSGTASENVEGTNGIPLIHGASATVQCERFACHDAGDHVIMVGRVVSYAVTNAATPRPLLFYGGRYRQLEPDLEIDTPKGVDYSLHGW